MKTSGNTAVLGESKDFQYWVVIYEVIPVLFAKDKKTNEIFISYESITRVMTREGKIIKGFYNDKVLSWMIEFAQKIGYPPLMDLPEHCKKEAKKKFGIITYRGIV